VRRPRVAILKPDYYGIVGGFERVVDILDDALTDDGYVVSRRVVKVVDLPLEVGGLTIPPEVFEAHPEYFRYLMVRQAFDRLDTGDADLVISTQPPSFSHVHPRHLALFFHHHRVYYDLEDVYVEAGFVDDPDLHRRAGEIIREIDQPRLDAVGWFLAGSQTVADRLAHFGGQTNVSLFHAGVGVGDDAEPVPATPPGTGPVLSISRMEFPKRSELAVAAAHLLPHQPLALVGTGSRERWVRHLDHVLGTGAADAHHLSPAQIWCNTGREAQVVPDDFRSHVEFAGRVSDDDLERRFRDAPCVLAVAHDEDYGLTAIEAMRHGRPVIVCTDGGGLTELVVHEQTGLIVDPTPQAVAAAIERLVADRDLAAELGRNGRDRAAELSWAHAVDEFRAGLERVDR
jgi:glycosyltransferase involved in cell wall biosynthesis